jgi:hypothetical protein
MVGDFHADAFLYSDPRVGFCSCYIYKEVHWIRSLDHIAPIASRGRFME